MEQAHSSDPQIYLRSGVEQTINIGGFHQNIFRALEIEFENVKKNLCKFKWIPKDEKSNHFP